MTTEGSSSRGAATSQSSDARFDTVSSLSTVKPATLSSENLLNLTLYREPRDEVNKVLTIEITQNVCQKLVVQDDSLGLRQMCANKTLLVKHLVPSYFQKHDGLSLDQETGVSPTNLMGNGPPLQTI